MLEFYRKNYMTNNKIINYFDIIIAVVLTNPILDWSISFAFKAPILLLLWLRAALTAICMMQNSQKQIGIGSVSLLLVILSLAWSVDIKHGDCIGDTVLKAIGLPSWTNGDSGFHLTLVYGVVFLIPAFILAMKYPDHLFAKAGKNLSWMGILLTLTLLAAVAFL